MQTASRTSRIVALALVSAILGGCGGGGALAPGAGVGGVNPPASATSNPVPTPTSGSSTQTQATTSQVVVTIPGAVDNAAQMVTRHIASTAKVRPQFVSPGSMGVTISATPQGGGSATTQAFDVSSGSPLCTTGSPRTCSLPVSLNAGSYTLTLTIYNEAPVSGSIPNGAAVLGVSNLSQTIVANQANTIAFTVQGVVSGISTSGGVTFGSLPANGTAQSYGVALVVTDASGNAITSGTYNNPISVSLAESGGSGHAYLVHNGSNSGSSATLTSATDTLAIHYDGGGTAGYYNTTTLSAPGASASAVQVSPMYVSGAVAITDQTQTKSVTITEANAPNNVAYSTTFSCSGFSKVESGTGASHTLSITSPTLTTGATVPSFSCPNPSVTDNFGSTMPVTYTGSLPTTTTCASIGSGKYLGVKSGSNYELANGTPCPLSVAASTVTVYDPSDGSHPASTTVAVSEANDETPPTVSTSSCTSGYIDATNGLTASGSPSGSLGGNVTVSAGSEQDYYGCTVAVSDGNGQTQNVTAFIDPNSAEQSWSGTITVDCENYGPPVGWSCPSGYTPSLDSFIIMLGVEPTVEISTAVAPTTPATAIQVHLAWSASSTQSGCAEPYASEAGWPGAYVTAGLGWSNEAKTTGWETTTTAFGSSSAITNGTTLTWYSASAQPGTYVAYLDDPGQSCTSSGTTADTITVTSASISQL